MTPDFTIFIGVLVRHKSIRVLGARLLDNPHLDKRIEAHQYLRDIDITVLKQDFGSFNFERKTFQIFRPC
jgi:hypothetical protein